MELFYKQNKIKLRSFADLELSERETGGKSIKTNINTGSHYSNRAKNSWIEYGAAVWALVFAVLHVAWAMGWYVGLDAESARKAFSREWFWAYNFIAAALCLTAAFLALTLVRSWGRHSRLFLGVLAWGCAGILTLRAAAAVVKAIILLANGESAWLILPFWDWWFCLGAFLFAASAWRFWCSRHNSARKQF